MSKDTPAEVVAVAPFEQAPQNALSAGPSLKLLRGNLSAVHEESWL